MNRSMGMIAGFALGLLCMLFVGGKRVPSTTPNSTLVANAATAGAPTPHCAIPAELIEAHYLSPGRQAMERKLRAALSCDFRKMPLKQVLQHFEEQSGLRFVLREDWLVDGGLEVSSIPAITYSCSDVSLKRALQKVLSTLSLSYVVNDDEIHVGPKHTSSGAGLITKLYPIGDLASRRVANRNESAVDELVGVITTTVEPETWEEVGGPASILYERDTISLLVRQTEPVHEEIEDVLGTLRQLRCRLPALLIAAGAPAATEFDRVEVSPTPIRQELATIDAEVRQSSTTAATHSVRRTEPEPDVAPCLPSPELVETQFLDHELQIMERKLRTNVSFDFEAAALADVLKSLEQQAGVPFWVDATTLDDEGIRWKELKFTRAGREVSLRNALERLLAPHQMKAVCHGDELAITARCGCYSAVKKIYPVADLVTYRGADHVDLVQDEISRLIKSIVAPEAWDDVGGHGSILFERMTQSFFINQDRGEHESIEDLLHLLRQNRCKLPLLLKSSGGPTVAEIRTAEASLEHAKSELLRLENQVRNLEGIDPERLPSGSAFYGRTGGGFFSVVTTAPESKGNTDLFMATPAMREIAVEARNVALRAMRLALRYEQLVVEAEQQRTDEGKAGVDRK